MTFETLRDFADWCLETDGITVQETDREGTCLTVENLENTDPLLVAELIITAHDSGFTIGSFFADRYGGEVTFY